MAYIDIKGELTFDLQPAGRDGSDASDRKAVTEIRVPEKMERATNDTAAPRDGISTREAAAKTPAAEDCVYQFPNGKQVDALLSDMMNQLTKIFVRAHEFMGRRGARRLGKRFKIIRENFNSRFFEEAYKTMSEEYRQSVNASAEMSRLASHDPCRHQREVEALWRRLLERARAVLKRAAVRCVSDFLRVRHRADDARTKERLAQMLLRELQEVRSNQLKVLCDNFQLCYKDLL